jgi:hypothetical protein
MKMISFRFLLGLVLMGLALGPAGCSSTPKQAAGFHAAVQVEGPARSEIQQVVEQVFLENQYEVVHAGPEFVFDKKAGTMKTLAYGSLSGKGVYSRVKVTVKNNGVGGYVIGCNAYVVRDRGDPTFEDEQKLVRLSGGDYQKMLEEVKKRLTR